MKKTAKSVLAVLFAAVIVILGVICPSADDSLDLKKGDELTYSVYLADCEKPVVDMVGFVFYDAEALESEPDTLEFPSLIGVNRNTDLEGEIPFNFSVLANPVDFTEKKLLLTVKFRVRKNGAPAPEFFVSDMDYIENGKTSPITEYSFTCDYAVNGKTVRENAAPVLPDESKLGEYQGAFINYSDGKGKQSGAKHEAVTGATQPIQTHSEDSQSNMTTLIIIVAVVMILLIAIIAVLRRHFSAEEE